MYEKLEIRGRQWWLRCLDDGPKESATLTEASSEDDESNVSMTTAEALDEEAE